MTKTKKNKDNRVLQVLSDLGLTETQASVYYSALSQGPSTVLRIAKGSGIKRTTVYSVIEDLKKKGYMRTDIKGFKSLYVAEDPEKLETMLEERRAAFRSVLPELTALHNLKGGESSIKYYEGLESVKSVYEMLIADVQVHDKYLVITDQSKWQSLDPDFFADFMARRAKLNIDVRLLIQDSEAARAAQKVDRQFNRKSKMLPEGIALTTNAVITPQHAVFHQLVEPVMAIVIDNGSIIKMHQELFEIIWRTLPDIETK